MQVNTTLFAFPVNLILGLLILVIGWQAKRLATPTHATIALGLVAVVSLVQGFLPPQSGFTRSWPFVVALLWLLVVLSSVLFRRPFRSISFFLNHAGLWLALWAGVLGACDASAFKLIVQRDAFTNKAFDTQAQTVHTLPFSVQLTDFAMETYPTGEPRDFQATIALQDASQTKTSAIVRVNHPVSYGGHQLYLQGYDVAQKALSPYCVLLVTRQPWRFAVGAGILMMIAGAGCTLFVKKRQL